MGKAPLPAPIAGVLFLEESVHGPFESAGKFLSRLRAGLREYLTRFGFGSATLDDLIGCWSEASGRDLAEWGHQWLRTEGVPTIWLDEGGAVRQDVPRWQRVGVGLFDLAVLSR